MSNQMPNATNRAEAWRTARLSVIRGLKNPSNAQRLLLELVDTPDRSSKDEARLTKLWRGERGRVLGDVGRKVANSVVAETNKARDAARTRRLCNLGGLMDMTELRDWDKGTLLGALLSLAQVSDPDRLRRWKASGDAMLAARSGSAAKQKPASQGPEQDQSVDTAN